MQLKESVKKVINDQVQHEFGAAYLYLGMAAYFESENLRGFSHWMKRQAQEEVGHAMKLFNHLFERGSDAKLKTIEAPEATWTSPLAAFRAALKHEQKVTGLIYNMMEIAQTEKDYASISFLQWFVNEQVEEESTAEEMVRKLEMIGDHKPALLMMDKELGSRQ